MERLDKILAAQNLGSRKDVHKLIRKKLVKVNGEICTDVSAKINGEQDTIEVNGQSITYKKHMYIMMNKPAGVLSAANDKKQKTVIDLVPEPLYRKDLFPAGRLDKDTKGLLIITNDGDFAHRMLSPKKKVYKLYRAELNGKLDDSVVQRFWQGIVFKDGTQCLPAELQIDCKNPNIGQVKICEGKFHQVKKMFLACGLQVINLKRLCIGSLFLDNNLSDGMCRELTDLEKQLVFKQNQQK